MAKPRHYSWFKFDWNAWRNDPALRRCSKETKGFWVDAIAVMEELDTCEIEGTVDELCRDLICSRDEFDRSIAELERTNAATIVKNQGSVKIISRRILKARNLTEYNRLKKEEERERKRVKAESNASSKNRVLDKKEGKKNSNHVELVRDSAEIAKSSPPEQSLEHAPSPPAGREPKDTRAAHPAIVAVREITERYPPKELWDVLIERLGPNVDIGFLRRCWTSWRLLGFKPTNYSWAMDWYADREIPPVPTGRNGNGTARENSAQRGTNARQLADELERQADARRRSASLLREGAAYPDENYQPR